ncbi:hypothetical protein SSAG_00027 [Streptomyces sp. Mg1]|nr:hypothetical protein SSAG_00027 [Streptomyces sp. Mg1]
MVRAAKCFELAKRRGASAGKHQTHGTGELPACVDGPRRPYPGGSLRRPLSVRGNPQPLCVRGGTTTDFGEATAVSWVIQ